MPRRIRTLVQAAFGKAELGGPGCWVWQGLTSPSGYGISFYAGRDRRAHQLAYEVEHGPIPEGLEIDHVAARGCVSRACVRPSHLEAVTRRENTLRSESPSAIHARKTHCPRGHELSGDNLLKASLPRRDCKACKRVSSKRSRDKARQERPC